MLSFLFASLIAMFVLMAVVALIQLRWARYLPELPAESAAGDGPMPFCSVVLAARNEEARVENTLRHLLAQLGVRLEIIVIDDRSTDGTGAILARLAAEDPRIRVATVESLPADWLGKCHACHTGAQLATAEWILFTDADCWLTPEVIARAVAAAEQEKADHVTLVPGMAMEKFTTRAWYLVFLISVLGWLAGVNRNRPKAHLGIGAFNLTRASAYRQCGGYEALRLTVVDDVKLGLLLSRGKFRTRAYFATTDVECHWGSTLREVVRILEKNYFAVLDYRLSLVLAGVLFTILVVSTIVAGLVVHSPLGIAAALSPLALILPAVPLARRIRWPWQTALGVPFMLPVFFYAMLRSTFLTLRQGGVRWRDTFYPLAQLRARGVR